VIVAVGSDKGSPGATTLAVLLALFWPGDRVVCEVDPRGADLPFRMSGVAGGPLAASPSIATLAVDTRPGAAVRPVDIYAQQTSLGVPLVPGEVSAQRFSRLAPHLPAITMVAAQWPGSVIADLGCLQPWNPSLLLARSAAAVVLVTRADTESLAHLRDRAAELAEDVGGPHRLRTPVGVVVRAEQREERVAVGRVEKLLASVGSPVPVLGALADDPQGAAALWSGQVSKRTLRRPLFASAHALTLRLRGAWPQLSEPNQWSSNHRDPAAATTGSVR
jgi:hypothetical protein